VHTTYSSASSLFSFVVRRFFFFGATNATFSSDVADGRFNL
jgi:hypothetical protein